MDDLALIVAQAHLSLPPPVSWHLLFDSELSAVSNRCLSSVVVSFVWTFRIHPWLRWSFTNLALVPGAGHPRSSDSMPLGPVWVEGETWGSELVKALVS